MNLLLFKNKCVGGWKIRLKLDFKKLFVRIVVFSVVECCQVY